MQVLADGIVQGLTIAILALGFALVYQPTRILHIALGGVYAAAPYFAWSGVRLGLPPAGAALLAVIGSALLSIALDLFNHRQLDRRAAGTMTHMMTSLGLYIVLVQSVALMWGNETKVLRHGLDREWSVAALSLTRAQAIQAATSILIVAGVFLWLRHSSVGLRLRAMASNRRQLALFGCNVGRLRTLAFGLSGALAGLSAILVAMDVGFSPSVGLSSLLVAIVAVFVGGDGSLWGVVAGGIALGVLRSELTWHLSARWQEPATYLVLMLALVASGPRRPWAPTRGVELAV